MINYEIVRIYYGNIGCGVFKRWGKKFERFLPKNQHTQRKLLKFGLMASCQKVPEFDFQGQFFMSKIIQIFFIFFYLIIPN